MSAVCGQGRQIDTGLGAYIQMEGGCERYLIKTHSIGMVGICIVMVMCHRWV